MSTPATLPGTRPTMAGTRPRSGAILSIILACQLMIDEALDGLTVKIPARQREF